MYRDAAKYKRYLKLVGSFVLSTLLIVFAFQFRC